MAAKGGGRKGLPAERALLVFKGDMLAYARVWSLRTLFHFVSSICRTGRSIKTRWHLTKFESNGTFGMNIFEGIS